MAVPLYILFAVDSERGERWKRSEKEEEEGRGGEVFSSY